VNAFSYAAGRKMYDSDSHVMETLTWLTDHATEGQRGLLQAPGHREGRRRRAQSHRGGRGPAGRPGCHRELLEQPLISGPKGWAAYGASTPEERSHALDLLGFEKQLVFPTFAMGQFAFSTIRTCSTAAPTC
jgi:uncharacterized protein